MKPPKPLAVDLLAPDWQPIEEAPRGEMLILYEPAIIRGRRPHDETHPARIVIAWWPTTYPRKATKWLPCPPMPEDDAPGGER